MTDRPRRSALYLPGSNTRAISKARTLAADAILLDLEDAVAPAAKEHARALVALKGGTVDIVAGGTITITGEINVSGGIGIDGSGGAARLEAGGALVAGVIDASSGSGDGSVELTSGATLTATGLLSVVGNAASSSTPAPTTSARRNHVPRVASQPVTKAIAGGRTAA